MIIAYTFVSVLLISLVSFIGALTLLLHRELLNKCVFFLVSVAVGALLGDVFIHIIPETYTAISNPTLISYLLIGGILIFFILERVLHWHHHTMEHAEEHAHPVGNMVLFGDGVHNFIDGLILATSYMVSIEVGIATTIAVILHEIPQEMGNFGVLIHAGFKPVKALWYNFLSSLTAVAGAGIGLLLGTMGAQYALYLLPITAGGFIYIALTDLVPELHKDRRTGQGLIQLLAIVIGVAAMALLAGLE